ncbi:MAG: presenilin family intramembrane aspartyl protease [Patescibacteria group bacterium]|nr:presenilin family intramembrane aspartyl protease [Patescibacteria group bacterium]
MAERLPNPVNPAIKPDSVSDGLKKEKPPDSGRFAWRFGFCAMAVVLALTVLAAGQPVMPEEATVQPTMSLGYFLTAFAAATLLLLLLIRSRLGTRVLSGLMATAVVLGNGILFWRLDGPDTAVLVVCVTAVIYLAVRRVAVNDLLLVVGLSGIAVDLGSALTPLAVAGALAALAVYDIMAVYATKHMVRAAEALASVNAPFALLVPPRWSDIWLNVKEATPQRGFMFLGTGDLVLPAVFAASVRPQGLALSVGVSVGALIGLWLVNRLFFNQKNRQPMPALPPVAAGATLGYLTAALIVR